MNIKKSLKKKVAVISMLGALGVGAGPKVEADLLDKLSYFGGLTGLIHIVWTIATGQDIVKWFMGKIDKPDGIWPDKKLAENNTHKIKKGRKIPNGGDGNGRNP